MRAVDRAGNSRAVRTYAWTVDLTPPGTTLGAPLPLNPSNSADATFRFASPAEDLARFECSLDAAAFTPCTSPQAYPGLADGAHQFRVRAVDTAGNPDPAPATYDWLIDTVDPGTTIDDGPAAFTNQTTATLRFSSANGDVDRFQCSLDGAAFANCTSPHAVTVTVGSHAARVRAIDAAGNSDKTPAERAWTVDQTPPDTAIGELGLGSSPSLTFSSPDADVDHFECALDAAPFTGCASPLGLAVAALSVGAHDVAVRAVDRAANADPTPATRGWTISQLDGDADGVPDAAPDNCVDKPNADQADRDKDGIGDACEVLPPGDLPAQAGVRAAAQVVSGEVFVKLPGRSAKAAQSGFVPLDGVATLPMGSLLDTRAGVAAITTAADFRRAADRRHKTQNARLAAGIFRIKQARKRRKAAPKRPFTDLALVSAAGSENVCATGDRHEPDRRASSARSRRPPRARSAPSAAPAPPRPPRAPRSARSTAAREPRTRVTRGKVRVLDRKRGRVVTVTARKSYIAKARLFRTKKGRRS